ncbi:hypothetical protein P4O66_015801 [Electrophorus voltai]|uniref:Uncharacterized protein n=1 Tax=Electrophorus voltai TaxID=2609070 RepID=A0AAD8YX27_9TELE|nr:hypothetical protein P4O66_015801 [Electrophorus voltai]
MPLAAPLQRLPQRPCRTLPHCCLLFVPSLIIFILVSQGQAWPYGKASKEGNGLQQKERSSVPGAALFITPRVPASPPGWSRKCPLCLPPSSLLPPNAPSSNRPRAPPVLRGPAPDAPGLARCKASRPILPRQNLHTAQFSGD